MAVRIFHESPVPFRHRKKAIKNWISGAVSGEGKKTGDINIISVSDDELMALNKKYLQRSYPTDVICFNYNLENTINGDIFIGMGKVKANAKEYGVSVYNEWLRVVIHGVLHLLGYDDRNTRKAEQMKEKEDYFLNRYIE